MDKFQVVFQHSMDALLIVDSESGKILETNQATHTLLGYSPGKLKGKPFTILLPPMSGSSAEHTLDEIRIFGAVFVQEFLKADGSTCFMDMTLTMIPWEQNSAILASLRDVTERIEAEHEREKLIDQLREATDKIKTLKGLLPICAHCKKIRNDNGYWQQVEVYVHEHSDAQFTHGICPDCIKKYYSHLCDEEH